MTLDAKPVVISQGHFHDENVQDVIGGMYAVVNEGGTGRAAALPNLEVCGKTGTAQLASTQVVKGGRKTLQNNAWFVAFAPRVNPEIVVVALFENGGESFTAVPIVRDVLKAYFDKKQRLQKGQLQLTREIRPPMLLPLAMPAAFLFGDVIH
jgi:penicillin-binding protein 2